MENSEKSSEALQDAEKPTIPPPAYQERASTYIEADGFQMVDAPATMPQDSTMPTAGPSSAAHVAPFEAEQAETPKRMPSILKGKGPAYAATPIEAVSEEQLFMPAEEKRPVSPAPPTLPSAEEEKKALQVHFAEQQEEEAVPPLPTRPSDIHVDKSISQESTHPSGDIPLKYTFAWNRPLLDFPTLEIRPADNATIPSSSPTVPPTSHWRLNYDKKYHARLHRYTATPSDINRNTSQAGDFPFRQIAEIKFPEFIIPGAGCGAMVKFDIHEEELTRLGSYATSRGKKPLPRVQKFMQCEGWLTTSYMMEVPVVDHLLATWKTAPRPKAANTAGTGPVEPTKETAIVERKTTDMEREAKKQNIALVTIGDMIETAKRTLNNETWTPYAPQQLVVESDGRVVATYQRASPFAKHAGVLTIHETEIYRASSAAEFIEGIVIATTSMVGMQDRIGLASGLMEAASTSGKWSQERWMKMQREWKDRRAKRQSMNPRPSGDVTANFEAKEQEAHASREVRPQSADDGLGSIFGDEEREAARREQMAWDESVKARSVGLDDELAGVISVEEREAARREHLAWEEWNRANALPTSASGTEQSQQAANWQEKPKFIYA